MDITPVYELRSRLRAVTIAGTNLLAEDFRLKRAAEAMQPLEAASPVFARIGALVRQLLAPGTEGKEGLLLDAITLVDALLCTQGEVAVSEEIKPLPIENKGKIMNNAPYSDLKALVEALTNSGGGRYSYLQEMHKKKPELFDDYRIKPKLVQALGASYAELAEDVKGWLAEMGESVLPLLEKGFDPKGKKEMLRRVEVIEAVAGAEANEFYLKQFPESDKEIRQALIFALRHSPENEELLQTLVKTEKGKNKKMAYYALACQESDGARECISKLAEKEPDEAFSALGVSGTEWASEMMRQMIFELLDKVEEETDAGRKIRDQETLVKDLNRLGQYLEALQGKNSTVVSECCRRVAAFAVKPRILQLQLTARVDESGYQSHYLKGQLAMCVRQYLGTCPDEEMVSLALELYQKYGNSQVGEAFFSAAMLAKLISCEDCTKWLWKEMARKVILNKLPNVLKGLRWDSGRQTWVMEIRTYNKTLEQYGMRVLRIKQKVEGDFLQLLMGVKDGRICISDSKLEMVIGDCIPDNDKEYENVVMEYFYRKASSGAGGVFYYCEQLKQHGYPECKGIAVQHFKKQNQIYLWEITNLLNALPGTDEAKRAEAQELLELIKTDAFKKKIQNFNTSGMERLESFVQSM